MTGNARAFRAGRNALFHRVKLAALGHYEELGSLDADSGWNAGAWAAALEGYFEVHDEIGTGPDARGPGLLIIDEQPGQWVVRQILMTPQVTMTWASAPSWTWPPRDEAGTVVLRVTDVGQL